MAYGCGVLHSAYLSIAMARDLSPFAMRTAFLFADYYGDSAAVGLAAGRQSRISVRATSECAVGAPFSSLSELIARRPSRGRVGAASFGRPCHDGAASDVVVDG